MSRLFPQLCVPALAALVTANNSPNHPRDGEAGYILSAINGQPRGYDNVTTGLQDARSCISQVKTWRSGQMSWQTEHTTVTPITVSNQDYSWINSGPSRIIATSLTTLCDGHPRVVGTARTEAPSLTTFFVTGTTYTSSVNLETGSYSSPSPTCSVNPTDCDALYTSALATTKYPDVYEYCQGSPYSFTTDPAGHTCDNCAIRGKSARLLYWPVRTKPGSGNLCGTQTPEFIPATPTGDGPNTAVYEGLTITSPTVGIYFESLSRVDGCGTILPSTVVTVSPEEVISVRGGRALFELKQFEFQDLNYRCQVANSSTYTIQDVPGDNCFQEVPAEAYFSGNAQWNIVNAWPTAVQKHLTIGDNYAPQILPPVAMSDLIVSIWGKGCLAQPDGVWDPPIALQEGANVEGPTRPVGASQTTKEYVSLPTSALPGEMSVTQPSRTRKPTLPTTISITAAPTVTLGKDTLTYTDVASGSSGALVNDHTKILVTTIITVGSQVVSPGNSGSLYVDGTAIDSPDATTSVDVGSDTYSVTSGSHSFVVATSGTSVTVSDSGSAATIGSMVVSAGSSSLVMNSVDPETTSASQSTSTMPTKGHQTSSNGTALEARSKTCVIAFLIVLLIFTN